MLRQQPISINKLPMLEVIPSPVLFQLRFEDIWEHRWVFSLLHVHDNVDMLEAGLEVSTGSGWAYQDVGHFFEVQVGGWDVRELNYVGLLLLSLDPYSVLLRVEDQRFNVVLLNPLDFLVEKALRPFEDLFPLFNLR
jgi:hypothetical protein